MLKLLVVCAAVVAAGAAAAPPETPQRQPPAAQSDMDFLAALQRVPDMPMAPINTGASPQVQLALLGARMLQAMSKAQPLLDNMALAQAPSQEQLLTVANEIKKSLSGLPQTQTPK